MIVLKDIRGLIKLRAKKDFCKRCNLLTPIAEENCIHCSHIPDDQIEMAKLQLHNTRHSISRNMIIAVIVIFVLVIPFL